MRFISILVLASLFLNHVFAKEVSVRTENTGFYSISQTDLLLKSKIAIGKIHLNNVNGEKAFFLESRKTFFKENDNLIFFSEMLHGQHTYQHPLDDFNGYSLNIGKKNRTHKKWIAKSKKNKRLPICESISTIDHLESNDLLIRVNTRQYKKAPELWYWKKISQINKKGFSVPLDFSKAEQALDASIRVTFRGINKDKNIKNIADHEVQVLFNGNKIETLNWQGKTQYNSHTIILPTQFIKPEDNHITFLVPKRLDNKKRVLDVVMLDYIDFQFAISPSKITASHALFSNNTCKFELTKQQFAYSTNNRKYAFDTVALSPENKVYIGDYKHLQAAVIQPTRPFDLDLSKLDYVMISHPLFIDAMQPLADFYKQKGMNVAVVDINDIYQKHSYGVRELQAIKDFIQQTYKAGKGRLKHVLLVGDSSWDWRNNKKYLDKYASWANRRTPARRNFISQKHFKYDTEIQNRDFVPTGQYHSSQGHSASDNWFVSIVPEKNRKGEDFIPDIAIGRFTAATVVEANTMVEKSINYQSNAKVGPWKSRVLWITNANKRYQNYSKRISNDIGELGAVAENIFPEKMDGDNLKVQETLTDAINHGDLIVHFVGHGGNSIWRIGPPDLKKNRDLFSLDHIDKLNNKDTLPFVMSMSCYSAPYDHPFADSIGEKFFRVKDKGAIAVLAASWRNSPNQAFSKAVIDNIYQTPRQSLGLAIMNAKRSYKGRVAVEMYNLLGDPALHLALPTLTMKTEISPEQRLAKVTIDSENFKGKVKVEFIDESSEVIDKQQFSINSANFTIKFYDNCKEARVYAWDSEQNIDAMSSFSCQ